VPMLRMAGMRKRAYDRNEAIEYRSSALKASRGPAALGLWFWPEQRGLFMGKTPSRVEVIMLGTGTSHGVPMIGCDCAVCASSDPRDTRTRPSIFVRFGEQSILVDTSPELRVQCLANDISRVDAVLFTHHHADHVVGLDDLRRFNWIQGTPIEVYATQRTFSSLHKMFSYAFTPPSNNPTSKPELRANLITHDPFTVGEETIVPVPLWHGDLQVLGFRFGGFAYCTDCSDIPESSRRFLTDLDVLVLDAVRRKPHSTHFSVDQAVEMAQIINARQTYFTHIAHGLQHEATNAELPQDIELAYDGQRIVLQ
jgi:phosphoribosyl 1,2-cyclic phosphate phosphodiesterase